LRNAGFALQADVQHRGGPHAAGEPRTAGGDGGKQVEGEEGLSARWRAVDGGDTFHGQHIAHAPAHRRAVRQLRSAHRAEALRRGALGLQQFGKPVEAVCCGVVVGVEVRRAVLGQRHPGHRAAKPGCNRCGLMLGSTVGAQHDAQAGVLLAQGAGDGVDVALTEARHCGAAGRLIQARSGRHAFGQIRHATREGFGAWAAFWRVLMHHQRAAGNAAALKAQFRRAGLGARQLQALQLAMLDAPDRQRQPAGAVVPGDGQAGRCDAQAIGGHALTGQVAMRGGGGQKTAPEGGRVGGRALAFPAGRLPLLCRSGAFCGIFCLSVDWSTIR
jgi:hypothetical protein